MDKGMEIEMMARRSFIGIMGMTLTQKIYDWAIDPKRIRRYNHRQALENLEDMRF